MHSTRKISILKRLSIILFLFTFVPITFIYMFLRDLPFLSSLFIEYVNTGTSLFFPFLFSPIIVFQFTTGHLIDIIIIINIVSFLERSGYHYYVKVCLRKNYSELYSETYFLESNRTQEEFSLNSDLLLSLKVDSDTYVNEGSVEYNFNEKSRINTNHFSSKSGYYRIIFKNKHDKLNYLHNSRNKNIQYNNYYTFFQPSSAYHLINYHFPSKNNNIFSNSFENFHIEEGR